MAIKMLKPLVPRGDGYTIAREPKRVDQHYLSDEHKAWRERVLRSAGYQCEAIDNGVRCAKRGPAHRLFADHIKELADGGAPYDVRNGQCLCGSHHTFKTAQVRAERARG